MVPVNMVPVQMFSVHMVPVYMVSVHMVSVHMVSVHMVSVHMAPVHMAPVHTQYTHGQWPVVSGGETRPGSHTYVITAQYSTPVITTTVRVYGALGNPVIYGHTGLRETGVVADQAQYSIV